ncbi:MULTISPECIES: thioredoxin [Ralstonia solanacearum species complex]|uniref:Thioredoxin n=2 Tax=Ralstonia solanacearum species complex TaxID=3116862 RepID=A0AAD0WGI1_RALSL|nr:MULTISPECIES: thioredoxin [Ralstonia solanacearum species complex]AXV82009.1 thioredoxin [Ralstonia solanacearum]AXW53139.1 thioredoxin [Ralstonia solanacearum]QUP54258.1 thioredoxin [Ralstonia syzygii]CBJ51644.1 conserved hypothethical protein, Thioredoxin-like domain [Ralstonia solanacearum PSI07]
MIAPLDPWTHAREIAERLSHPSARLVVVLGAESWCEKCRTLRPAFDAWAMQAAPHEVRLWLDIEDHAEFIGPDLPADLPMLIAYEGARLTHAHVLKPGIETIEHALDGAGKPAQADPGILARLTRENWAT